MSEIPSEKKPFRGMKLPVAIALIVSILICITLIITGFIILLITDSWSGLNKFVALGITAVLTLLCVPSCTWMFIKIKQDFINQRKAYLKMEQISIQEKPDFIVCPFCGAKNFLDDFYDRNLSFLFCNSCNQNIMDSLDMDAS
ncbi:MAG: hypothetical protein FK730_14265 [Asgard group archaeon]|nr:hypothetical protein [Asgard group archaeon]